MPVLTACLLDLMVASSVSEQVPNSAPNMMAIPAGKLNKLFLANVMAMPTVADEDWTISVVSAPMPAPVSGFSSLIIQDINSG